MHLITRDDYPEAVEAIRDILLMYVDMDLLRSGSAVTIVCWYYDLWCERQSLRSDPGGARIEAALANGRLAAFPDVEAVLRDALSRDKMPLDDPWFDRAAAPIYRRYVRGFFQRLADADRQA